MAGIRPTSPRPELGHARQRLLDAARGLLLAGGPQAVTVHAIAELVGVRPPALYKHFSSREEVIDTLITEAWAMFRAALAQARRGRTPKTRLLRCGEAYLEFGFAEPVRYRLLFMQDDDDFRHRPTPLSEEGAGAGLRELIELVRACQRAGDLPSDRPAFEVAVGLWATCHGLVSLWLAGGGAQRFALASYRRLARRILRHSLVLAATP